MVFECWASTFQLEQTRLRKGTTRSKSLPFISPMLDWKCYGYDGQFRRKNYWSKLFGWYVGLEETQRWKMGLGKGTLQGRHCSNTKISTFNSLFGAFNDCDWRSNKHCWRGRPHGGIRYWIFRMVQIQCDSKVPTYLLVSWWMCVRAWWFWTWDA